MQRSQRIPSSEAVQSAQRDRRNFVCVLGRDPERNKIPRTNLWTVERDASGFASSVVATMRPGKVEGNNVLANRHTRRCTKKFRDSCERQGGSSRKVFRIRYGGRSTLPLADGVSGHLG